MNPWIRRSLKVGLLAGGFVCIGTGIASARGTSPSPAAPSSDLTQVVARQVPLLDQATTPLYRVKSDPVGSVLGEATKLLSSVTGSLAPPSGIQPLPAASTNADSPASGSVSVSAHGSASPDSGASLEVSVSAGLMGKSVTATASAGSSSAPHVSVTSNATTAATATSASSKSANLLDSVPVLGQMLSGSGSAAVFSTMTPDGPALDGAGSLELAGSLPAVQTDSLPSLDSLTSALPTGLPSLDTLTSALPTGLPGLDSLTSALPISGLTSALPLGGLPVSLPI
jgi:hypothetical protein